MQTFVRDVSDKRRVVIVDAAHLFYKYAFGGASSLSATIMIDGKPQVVDTTLPAYTIKSLVRWSVGGYYPLVVCFDAQGGNRSRRAYFAQYSQKISGGQAVGYKESRSFQDDRFYQGVNITANLLIQGGVCVLRAESYESDDLIKAAVDKAKEMYPHLPIDIITGDQDMLPLVDEQVSVFIMSKRMTWAEDKSIEKRGYVQITPSNYQSYIETLSEFKGLTVPYNTVLLKKLLRGKKADDIPGYKGFTPTKYNNLVRQLQEDGYSLDNVFRYGNPIKKVCYRGTGEEVPADLVDSTPREQLMLKFEDPVELNNICSILSQYLSDEVIQHVRYIYRGVNLNTAFVDVPDQFKRKPALISADISGYVLSKLQQAVSVVRINLPVL